VNIVAIETATETIGVAVRTGAGVQAEFVLTGRRRHVESLAPALEHLLAQVGLAAPDLEAIAVDLGPGLFTGLRVGVAAAKGLAQALGLGIVGLSSLEILTSAAGRAGHTGFVLAAIDARRGEVFVSGRAIGAPGDGSDEDGRDPVIAPRLVAPADLGDLLAPLGGRPVLAVGDGAQRYAEVLNTVPGVSCVVDALSFPPPSALLALASAYLEEGGTPVAPDLAVPLYMREADATSNFARFDSPQSPPAARRA
jgi:tRNA threonylcarbamoyladenosine biosynthesis protein TsaB